MAAQDYEVGMIVENPRAPPWGPERIIAIEGQTVTVHFRGDPAKEAGGAVKKISLDYCTLAVSNQADPFPKHSRGSKQKKAKIKEPPFTMQESISSFLKVFPLGFKDPGYIGDVKSGERQCGATETVRRRFSPEFMNCIDAVIVFRPPQRAHLEEILGIELAHVQDPILSSAQGRPFVFTCTARAREFLLQEGTDAMFGARHLKRAIERHLVFPLSNLVATGQARSLETMIVDYDR